MWISKIRIKNFRPFYGEQEINYERKSKEKIVIIHADSDVGKTSFLSALTWCLYQNELADAHPKAKHPFNTDRKYEIADGAKDEMYVEITLNDDETDLRRYKLKRAAICKRRGNDITFESEPSISISEWQDNELIPELTDPAECKKKIRSILPEEIYPFFILEGEALYKHFSFRDPKHVGDAIESVSQISQIKSALEHINATRETVYDQEEESEQGAEFNKVKAEYEKLKNANEGYETNIRTYTDQIRAAEAQIEQIETELIGTSAKLLAGWAKERKDLEDANKDLNVKIGAKHQEVADSLLDDFPSAILSSPLHELQEQLKNAKGLPPNVRKHYLEELLERKQCICTRTLSSKTDKREVEALLKIIESKEGEDDLTDIVFDGKWKIKEMLAELPHNVKKREKLHDDIRELNRQITKNEENIRELSGKIGNKSPESVKKSEAKKIGLTEAIGKQREVIGGLKQSLKTNEPILQGLIQKKEMLAKGNDNYKSKKEVDLFLEKAASALETLRDEILREIRGMVQKKTFTSFRTLHWDKGTYTSFTIEDDYNMSLKDNKGDECVFDLAGGTKQILLLSFVSALADVSGYHFPIFISSPLADTDNKQRENIARYLPDFLKNNQVTLLVKDQEYTPEFDSIIKSSVSAKHIFKRKQNEFKTSIDKIKG